MKKSSFSNIGFIVLFTLFLVACSSSLEDVYSERLTDFQKQLNVKIQTKYILIIPNQGCGGCINSAVVFAKENLNKYEISVIFTEVYDAKLLRLKIGKSFLVKSNVFVDKDNIFSNSKTSTAYPKILKLSNNEVIEVSDFNKDIFLSETK